MHLEFIGLVTLTILVLKSIYNLVHFFYSVYLASVLGFNIDPRQYGPWAGTWWLMYDHDVAKVECFCIIMVQNMQ